MKIGRPTLQITINYLLEIDSRVKYISDYISSLTKEGPEENHLPEKISRGNGHAWPSWTNRIVLAVLRQDSFSLIAVNCPPDATVFPLIMLSYSISTIMCFLI